MGDGRKEAIQYSSSHERLERSSARTPRSSRESNYREPEEHGQSTKVRGEGNGKDTAGTDHEQISNGRMIDRVFAHVPFSVQNHLSKPPDPANVTVWLPTPIGVSR